MRSTTVQVALYVVVTAAITAPFWWLQGFHRGALTSYETGFALMYAPAAAALLVGRARELGWAWPPPRYLVFAYVVPIGVFVVAYGTAWAVGFASFFSGATLYEYASYYKVTELGHGVFAVLAIVWALTVQTLFNSMYAIGEEVGWRGFLVPALSRRLGLLATGLISGAVWAAWHFPLMVTSKHGFVPYEVACFSAMVMSVGIILAWLRLRSASVWPAVLFHGTHNAMVGFLDTMAGDTGEHAWFFSENGIGLAVVYAMVAVAVVLADRRARR